MPSEVDDAAMSEDHTGKEGVPREPTVPATAAEAETAAATEAAAEVASEGTSGHVEDHEAGGGHEAEHGHDGHDHEEPLGPIDVAAWGAGLVGVGAALAVVVVLAISLGWI
jgi:hypothetical protein